MTAGRARVGRLGQETEIGPGEAARWLSDVDHGYSAVGTDPVTSVLVIRSPVDERHNPSSRTDPGDSGRLGWTGAMLTWPSIPRSRTSTDSESYAYWES